MSVELRVLSGARAGQREVYSQAIIAIGRHPLSDLQFDPEGDRDVSARHAEIREHDGRCTLRDVGSTNGTFVNGRRIADNDEHLLMPGDVISFGELGPKVEFRFSQSGADFSLPQGPPRTRMTSTPRPPSPSPAAHQPSYDPQPHYGAPHGHAQPHGGHQAAAVPPPPYQQHGGPPLPPTVPPGGRAADVHAPHAPQSPDAEPPILFPKRPTNERVAMAVKEQTRPLRWALLALILLLVVGVGGAFLAGRRGSAAQRLQLAEMLRQTDSARKEMEELRRQLQGQLGGLDSALRAAQQENEQLQAQLKAAQARRNSGANLADLQRKVNDAQRRTAGIASAAAMDNSAIYAANNRAIVMISVEHPDGKSFTGTGVSLTRDGLIVTNKHLILGEGAQAPRRVAVIFADTKAWVPARLVKTSATEDLAFIKLDIEDNYPTIGGIARSAERAPVGAPVAIIGYPFGTELPMEGSGTRVTARASLFVGTVSKSLADVLQIDSYAGEGSSGSPLFDRRGDVVGIIYGGARESGGRIVYAIPSERLIAELPAEAKGIVR